MQIRAKIQNQIARDYKTGEWIYTITSKQQMEIGDLIDKDLDVLLKEHKDKRTLRANNYFWQLCQKIGEKMYTSREEVYERILTDYGCFDEVDGIVPVVEMRKDIPVRMLGGHWVAIEDDGSMVTWMKLKGTSEMDTKEFSQLTQHVVEEAKLLGIETLTPAELERMFEDAEHCSEKQR